jgi:D-beta-D-heptose 7-phosphate kinase/D-beta-D-heptose 1-phosphate adenosyltransferase
MPQEYDSDGKPMSTENTPGKILNWDMARKVSHNLHRAGRTLVFTNGCFDLLHLGHLRYLSQARSLGDYLMIGLNSDRSVREIKGPSRPIVPSAQRAEVLAGWEVVGGVVIFDQADPLELILNVEPDILVKGGDWPLDRIVGRDQVEKRGGRVLTIPLTPGISTTALVERILALHTVKSA